MTIRVNLNVVLGKKLQSVRNCSRINHFWFYSNIIKLINKYRYVTEPVGGAAPKFSSSSKTIGTFDEKGGDSLALVCPAQANPLPSFRYMQCPILYLIKFIDAPFNCQ